MAKKSVKSKATRSVKSVVKKNSTKTKANNVPLKNVARRKIVVIVFALLFAGIGSYYVFQSNAATSEIPKKFVNNKEKGLKWDDLEEGPSHGRCAKLLVPKDPNQKKNSHGEEECTHGPDIAPPGVDVRKSVEPLLTGENDAQIAKQVAETATDASITAATVGIPCDGDGVSGNRIEAIYARASDVPSRYDQFATSFPQYAANVNTRFVEAASATGGTRNLRWVTDAGCNLVVRQVTLSPTGDDTFSNTKSELASQGFNRTDRKYILWVDSNVYCGIGDIRNDDRPTADNANNFGPRYGRNDAACWNYAEAHELMHNLGGVQLSAPNSSGGWHCTDEYDLECYSDASGVTMVYKCPSTEARNLDCNKDDYFYAGTPPAGNYLATKWNTANSSFLIGGGTVTPPPPPPPSDIVLPTVKINSPADGSTVGTSITISASATDNVGVRSMSVYIDGNLKASSSTGTISYKWNSRKASRGTHTILVKASDAAGNVGQTSISVVR